jgi:serine/threonine-protein kinase
MGQVWQAVDEVLDRPVAVKLLRDKYAHDPSFVRRLRAEARYGAALTPSRHRQRL